MYMKRTFLFIAIALLAFTGKMFAQNDIITSSSWLKPVEKVDNMVPFRIDDEGQQFPVMWGLDVAWNSAQNIKKGINFIGKDNLGIARASFQTTHALTNDTELTADQIATLRSRINNINLISNTIDIILNEDQEAGIIEYYTKNGRANVDHWCALIAATVRWIHTNTQHKVVAISPFNEPDYTAWGQGTIEDFYAIAEKLKTEYSDFANIAIAAGNTLNCDRAWEWYSYMKPYATWGNTHQLAGSFDTYANFFTQVRNDGAYALADELHNVGEAIVGVEYGMQGGIWWGFDAGAWGEFCHASNEGVRIGYSENRDKWTSAAVYRNDKSNKVFGFVGSSERQAKTTKFMFVSRDRDVYFNGQGPQREFVVEVPGGTGYQQGQTNAECLVQIEYGEDVPVRVISGTYKIVNAYSGKVVTSGGEYNNAPITQSTDISGIYQQWDLTPVPKTVGGDFSYWYISCKNFYMDVKDFSTTSGATVMCYNGEKGANEQWLFEYAGNGFYRIKNKESNLYLETAKLSTNNGIALQQGALSNSKRQLWHIIPTDITADIDAPATPTGLMATPRTASVELTWNPNTEADLDGYMVIRQDKETGEWNTIARRVQTCHFIDNTCEQYHGYVYKLRAIDKADNMSVASETVEAAPTSEQGLMACWQMENNSQDISHNRFDAMIAGEERYRTTQVKQGDTSLYLDGSTNYLRLPHQVANLDEMTFTAWVYWTNSSVGWQRIFDFGTGEKQYMFLTPSNGSIMRFAIKDGGDEQLVSHSQKMPSSQWVHVSVTIGSGSAKMYMNGELVGQNNNITIKPSDFKPMFNYIGRSQFDRDPYFRGYIDDVRIYNHALTQAEIVQVMNGEIDAIETIDNDNLDTNATFYTVDGIQVARPEHGIYIMRTANGTVRKIMVK